MPPSPLPPEVVGTPIHTKLFIGIWEQAGSELEQAGVSYYTGESWESWEAGESWEHAERLERAGNKLGVSWKAGESWE